MVVLSKQVQEVLDFFFILYKCNQPLELIATIYGRKQDFAWIKMSILHSSFLYIMREPVQLFQIESET